MNVIKVWVPPREYLSVQALYDAANALYWKISERQNSTHLAFLKHQNTKTSLCELSKNHWVIALFIISGSIRRKLQSTVSLDHSVLSAEMEDYEKGNSNAERILDDSVLLSFWVAVFCMIVTK